MHFSVRWRPSYRRSGSCRVLLLLIMWKCNFIHITLSFSLMKLIFSQMAGCRSSLGSIVEMNIVKFKCKDLSSLIVSSKKSTISVPAYFGTSLVPA